MFFARQSSRMVRSPEVFRTMNQSVYIARRLVSLAHEVVACATLHRFVAAHGLVTPSFTVHGAIKAKTARAFGGSSSALPHVIVTNNPATSSTRCRARRTHGVLTVDAQYPMAVTIGPEAHRALVSVAVASPSPVNVAL